VLAVLMIVIFMVLALNLGRWAFDRAALSNALERGRARSPSAPYDHDEIRALPAPVVRYFEAALTPGRPFLETVTLVQEGTLRTPSELRFRAIARITTRRPGFVWEARVAGPFGLVVIDAYANGQGSLDVALLYGGVRLQRVRKGVGPAASALQDRMAESQLQRWLAEAPWYPTALLPRAGVTWEAVDDTSARATVTDGLNAATLLFRFGNDALVESVHAESRGREVRGQLVGTPWEGRFSNPVERGGCVVPRDASARWLPNGSPPEPYWYGTVVDFRYDLDQRTSTNFEASETAPEGTRARTK